MTNDIYGIYISVEAYHLGLYGRRYVWMLLGWYSNKWWRQTLDTVNCTSEQLDVALTGYFAVDSLNTIIGSERSISGLVS